MDDKIARRNKFEPGWVEIEERNNARTAKFLRSPRYRLWRFIVKVADWLEPDEPEYEEIKEWEPDTVQSIIKIRMPNDFPYINVLK